MKLRTTLTLALLLGGSAVGYYYWTHRGDSQDPLVMQPDGSATQGGLIVQKQTIDWVAILKTALVQRSRFLTLTLAQDVVQDSALKTTLLRVDALSSHARVRVKYHVEYPIGYVLDRRSFAVAGDATGLFIALRRPQLVATPAVKLKSARVVDGGLLIDEQADLVKLQQRIQPQAERRAAAILSRPDIIPRSEQALRSFLEPLLARQADGGKPPPIKFVYYQ